MRYALPIALWVSLAALIVISPHIEPQRLRVQARQLAEQLRARHGFRDGSRASWAEVRSSGWPPFHYGRHRSLDNILIGTVDSLPVRLAGYEVTFNGSRHRYGLVLVGLPQQVERMGVRGERPFSAARVSEHVPDGALTMGIPEFDAAWSVYADMSETLRAASSAGLALAMLSAPTRFCWRADGTDLLLWKRDGWSDKAQLFATISCVRGCSDSPTVTSRLLPKRHMCVGIGRGMWRQHAPACE